MKSKFLLFCIILLFILPAQCFADDFFCPGDFTGDCRVDWSDLAVFAESWLLPGTLEADLDGSNSVDFEDFALFAEHWLMTGGLDGSGFMIFNISDIITNGPWVDARNYVLTECDDQALVAALNDIGNTKKTLLIAGGNWQISNSLVIPSNIKLRFEVGSYFNINTGKTVTINGKLDAGLFRIFAGSGNVIVSSDAVSRVYPQWWGAVTTGVNISQTTAALKAAVATGKAFLPDGYYIINGNIGSLAGGSLVGAGADRSTIICNNTSVAILNVAGDAVIRDIGFRSGGTGIKLSTGTNDALVKIESCFFKEQVIASIADDSASLKAKLNIADCDFTTCAEPNSSKAIDVGVNVCSLTDSWMYARGNIAITNRCQVMTVQQLLGVPEPNPKGSCWFENFGSLYMTRSRFGAEDCGRIVIKNYAALKYQSGSMPTVVCIEDGFIYSACQNALEFYELPNTLILRNNYPYNPYVGITGLGLYLDSATISSQTKRYFSELGCFINDDKVDVFGSQEITQLLTAKDYKNFNFSSSPLVSSDVVFSMPTANSSMGNNSTTPFILETFPYNGIDGRKYMSTADGQNISLWYTVPSAQLSSNNIYTAVFDIINESDNPVIISVFFGYSRERYVLSQGMNILNVPYFWVSSKSTVIRIKVDYLNSGDIIKTGRFRIFKGNHTQHTVNTIMYGDVNSSVPVNSYVYFYPSDKIIHMNSIAGDYAGRQCVSAGTPGIWKNFGQIDW
ncbi:MAG: hypothetical protein ACYC54_15565 [Sedimentisphaerales bacterium]